MRKKLLILALSIFAFAISCRKNNETPLSSTANSHSLTITGIWNVVHTSFTITHQGSMNAASTRTSSATASWDFSADGHLYVSTPSGSYSYKMLNNGKVVLFNNNTSDTLDIKSATAKSINLSNSVLMPNGSKICQSIDLVQ